MASHHSSNKGRRSVNWKKSALFALFLAFLVLVGAGSYLLTERRHDLAVAADARTYTKPTFPSSRANAAPTTTRVNPSTAPRTTATRPPAVASTAATTPPAPTSAPPTTTASVQPAAFDAADQSFLELLTVSGYLVTPQTSQSFVDTAKSVCAQLQDGVDGQEVLNAAITTAEQNGSSRDEGEGLVYIGVASYCNDASDQLP
ncbi:DUF732 domain-containing protein [Actinomycetes bacterium M1A6_2h]